ncbi:MAG: DNA-directed RNA polymerase subunit D [Candidatus Thermoplasmatota archaeon]|jgi:DNA-directed RNA polymerase subunit D|nr:DNA-directed RNA polymerase subunit D [Candidatus Thermoplasmatota archaeon]
MSQNIKMLEEGDTFIRFEISDITPAYANLLRRTLINDIPKLAISRVNFHHGEIRQGEDKVYSSSTSLFDEVIASRIGMIPLPTDLKMNERETCSCGGSGCPLCTVNYSLFAVGPKMVTSGDLISLGDAKFSPVDKEIPIVELNERQAIMLDGEAYMGKAREHARFQSTSGVSYSYHRELTVSRKEPDVEEIMEKSPKNVLSKNETEVVFTTDFPSKYMAKLYRMDSLKVKEDDTRFVFSFETDGSLKAREVLTYAIERIRSRLEVLREQVPGE